MLWTLVAASTIAILTTIGIVLSMLSETIRFFSEVSPFNFFFGTVWDPRFSSAGAAGDAEGQFGLMPLLAGTLYIAFVSMLVAVPVGLMAAIYLGEYARAGVRSIVKPLIEMLAGIPTIVYGFFALVTVGPFLRDLSVAIAGGSGFIQAQSVLTAGLVMGIMIIPFVSSLSRRHHQRGAARHARRLAGARRHPLRNHPQGPAARRPAGHCRRPPARRVARHRRNHDRGAGRGHRRAAPRSIRSSRCPPLPSRSSISSPATSISPGRSRWSPLRSG